MSKRNAILLFMVLFGGLFVFWFGPTEPQPAPTHPKVLFTNFHPTHSGGHLTYIRSIVKSELKNHYTFAIATPKTSDIFEMAEERGLQTYPCEFPGKVKETVGIIKAILRFREICKTFEPDIIHTNGGHDNTIAIWGSLFLRKKPRIVRTFHGTKKIGKDPYHWLVYNKWTDSTLFVSSEALAYNDANGGLKLHNAQVIENGVNLYHYAPLAPSEEVRQKLQIPEGTFVFGSCAGLADYKRVDLMLEAAQVLKETHDFKILILGDANNGLQLQQQAVAMGLEDIFIYAGYHKDIRPYCSLFDVGFILSDRVETISFASREMMAMGIPLISSSYGGLTQNVTDMSDGRLVKPGQLEGVIEAMRYFLELPKEELAQYRKNARLKAQTQFGLHKQLHALDRAYREILTGGAHHSPAITLPHTTLSWAQ